MVPGQRHLLLSDSIARDVYIRARAPDTLLDLAVGSNTFRKMSGQHFIPDDWLEHCQRIGQSPGTVVIWCGGNDQYEGSNTANASDRAQERW